MAYSYTLTPKDIYGVEEPEVPKGYKVVGFRPPMLDELYISNGSYTAYKTDHVGVTSMRNSPRLILEKLPEKRILEIANCGKCFNRSSFGYCTLSNNRYVSFMGIPEWCPLPKAKIV